MHLHVCVMMVRMTAPFGCILRMHYSLYRQMASWGKRVGYVLGFVGEEGLRRTFSTVNNEYCNLVTQLYDTLS